MKNFVRILSLSLATLMLLVVLVACAPAKSSDKAAEALKANGYIVTLDTRVQPGFFKVAGYSLDSVVSASKIETDSEGNKTIEHITVYYFADKKNATKAMAEVEKYANEDKESGETKDSVWVAPTRSGSMIYYGTKAAIKAAR